LGKSEEWFWDSELRIVWYLLEEKKKIDKTRMKNQAIYIASYVWGNDIDDEEESEEEGIAGIDYPVDESMLRGFYG
jgi:hypothetical protein